MAAPTPPTELQKGLAKKVIRRQVSDRAKDKMRQASGEAGAFLTIFGGLTGDKPKSTWYSKRPQPK